MWVEDLGKLGRGWAPLGLLVAQTSLAEQGEVCSSYPWDPLT